MLETELVANIISFLNKYQIRNTREIRMGIGIPDIVINIGASKSMSQIFDYYILLLIEYINQRGKVTLNEVIEYLSFDRDKCQKYINILVEDKFIFEKNKMLYSNRNIMGYNLGKIISIEAKIGNWKKGVLQAQRYLMFSDYSYLALPEKNIHNVDKDILVKIGIGLLSVNERGIEEVVAPNMSHKCDFKQKYIATSAILKNAQDINKRKNDGIFSKL